MAPSHDGAETVRFALRGQAYEVDLAPKNQEKLEKALQPFIEAARSPGGQAAVARAQRRSRQPRSTTGGGGERVDYSLIDYAGNVHRGRVTEAEAETVRNHLDDVNERLSREGRPPIDPKDSAHKKRYGF